MQRFVFRPWRESPTKNIVWIQIILARFDKTIFCKLKSKKLSVLQ